MRSLDLTAPQLGLVDVMAVHDAQLEARPEAVAV